MKFASIGDLCIDTYSDKKLLGGTAYNSALVAKKYGADVSLISAIGEDENGQLYTTKLKEQDIDYSHVTISSDPTSTLEVTLDKSHSPIFGTWNLGALGKWELNQNDLEFIKQHDIAKEICLRPLKKNFQTFCNTPMPHTLKAGDFNGSSQYSSFTPGEIAEYADGLDVIVKSIDADNTEIINEFQTLSNKKNKIVLLTLGSKGSMCLANNQTYVQDAPQLDVTNTTGFGDAFIAVFLITYFSTKDIQQSMITATAAITNLSQM